MTDIVTQLSSANSILGEYNFAVCTREEFFRLGNIALSPEVLEQLQRRASYFTGKFVVYDPLANGDGWLLVGDNMDELVKETLQHIE